MTPRQKQTLDFIGDYYRDHGGVSPSYQEICDHLGIKSKGMVYELISALERDGLIYRARRGHRSLRTLAPTSANGIPIRPDLAKILLECADSDGTTASAMLNEAIAAYLGVDEPVAVAVPFRGSIR